MGTENRLRIHQAADHIKSTIAADQSAGEPERMTAINAVTIIASFVESIDRIADAFEEIAKNKSRENGVWP